MEKRNFLTTTWGIFLVAMICCFLWGSAFPSVKIGYRLFQINTQHIPTLLVYAGTRFSLAGVLAILFGSVMRRKVLLPSQKGWWGVLSVCLFQTVLQYLFYYVGFANTTGVKGSIIVSSGTFISILVACFLFRQEKFTARKAVGCLFGFGGVVLINLTGSGLGGGFAWNGEALLLCSSTAYAISFVVMRIHSQYEDPIVLSGYQFLLGGLILAAIGLLGGGTLRFYSAGCYAMMGYLSFISAGAFTLWSLLLKYNPVSRVSIFNMMTPIFGVFTSAVFLNEGGQVSWPQCLCALALVSMGIFIINRPEKVQA